MIQITRSHPEPPTLRSAAVASAKEKIKKIAKRRKPKSKEFTPYWGRDDVRTQLWEMQHRKCCYCERKREKNRESDIEHYRPKAGVTEADPKHKGYWWLAYVWSNLFFSCRYCNQHFKKNRFPVSDEAKRVSSPSERLESEDPMLLNPETIRTEEHFGFDWFEKPSKHDGELQWLVYISSRSEQGRHTENIVGLNQSDLPVERGSLVLLLEGMAQKMIAAEVAGGNTEKFATQIRAATSSREPFAAFRREYFRQVGLGEYVSDA